MIPTFTVQPGEPLSKIFPVLPRSTIRQCIISGISDGARWGETRFNRLIRETLMLSRDRVDEAIHRRTTRDTAGEFGQAVIIRRKKIDLKDYKPKQSTKGVRVRLFKGGKLETIRGAFIDKNGKAGRQTFKRKTKKRLPIVKLFGPTPIGVVVNDANAARVEEIQKAMADKGLERIESKLLLAFQKRNAQ